ncbi:hypothetical protein [Streptomyces sp. PLM4]|uniref:hypothetical protein n=1 Tax=Streptomyces TaxID=1883 RepID=UPI00204C68DC|nr:hypothetical protein [Streptomyces sp. PLM4]BDH71844.1 hypothetical protein MTP06_52930 [Streptomyces sp. PLM4]
MTASPAPDLTVPREVPYAFRYRLPEEFVAVREPATTESWSAVLTEIMPGASPSELAQAADSMRRSVPLFMESHDTLVDVALCMGAERVRGQDMLSYGLVMVSARPSDHDDRLLAAEGMYRAKERQLFSGEADLEELDFPLGKGLRGRQDTLLASKLPSGPGVMSASLRSVTLRTTSEAGADTQRIPMAVLQLIIPAPHDYCVYVTVSTPSVYLLDSYSERLAHIGRTFSFDSATLEGAPPVKEASGFPRAVAAPAAPHGDGA